jgi:hypothetical protein
MGRQVHTCGILECGPVCINPISVMRTLVAIEPVVV